MYIAEVDELKIGVQFIEDGFDEIWEVVEIGVYNEDMDNIVGVNAKVVGTLSGKNNERMDEVCWWGWAPGWGHLMTLVNMSTYKQIMNKDNN